MRKLLLSCLGMGITLFAGAQVSEPLVTTQSVGEGVLLKVTPPLRGFKPDPNFINVPVRDENGRIKQPGYETFTPIPPNYDKAESLRGPDPAAQEYTPEEGVALLAALGTNFNGMGYTAVNPPDPTVAVGPNHVVQMINGGSGAYLRIYNKSGTPLINQVYMDNLTGKGGLGDPIVLYDHLADRFVMTEFANKGETGTEGLIMAVSQTSDPTGSWYVYFFSTGSTFPDYPKFSVWPDGYYATSNDFANGQTYNGSTIYAFNRSSMIAGQPLTSFQSVKFSTSSYTKYFAMSPVLLQGNTLPPAGTGGLVAYMVDDTWTSSTADRDSVGLIEFKVNWTTPASSQIINISSLQAVAFKSQICTASRGACIPQPGTNTKLEALHQRVMNQPVYRNFDGTEGIVLSFSVDVGSSRSGIRWYELRKTGPSWGINQESTWAPNDAIHRWMPSIAYDGNGAIGLVYNVSASSTVFPGVRFTGRRSCDPLNTMTTAETVIINGTSRNSSSRYGDYNHLVADPNGQSFWMTAQWNGATTWSTRIANFSLPTCEPVVCNAPTGLSSSNIGAGTATVSWSVVTGATGYAVDYKAVSSSTWITAASSTTSTSVNLSGLSATTQYDWRVRTFCGSGQSDFVLATFTTAAPTACNQPTGLSSSNITSNGATVSWAAVSGALNYTVEYKEAGSGTWTTAATATTATSVNLSGLSAATVYDWQVRTNCSGNSSAFVQAQFTTADAPPACTDDYEPNDVSTQPKSITPGVGIEALLCSTTDRDWYTFTNTNQTKNVRVSLTIPAGLFYYMRLVRPNGQIIGPASGSGTTVSLTASGNPTGAYRVEVYSSISSSTTAKYGLLAEVSGTAFSGPSASGREFTLNLVNGLHAFPNPARGTLNIAYEAGTAGEAEYKLTDLQGRVSISQVSGVVPGINYTQMDVQRLASGTYIVRVKQADRMVTQKVVIIQ